MGVLESSLKFHGIPWDFRGVSDASGLGVFQGVSRATKGVSRVIQRLSGVF